MIKVKRVYEPSQSGDGVRILVDRFWPRGIRKQDLPAREWLKEVAPSRDLCHWFGHDPEKWGEFQSRYRRELELQPETWQPLLEAARKGNLTLVYSARDAEHNNALVLKAFLEERLKK